MNRMRARGIVRDPALKSVMVLPSDPSLDIAGTVQFSAVATYNNGTTDDVTAQATWGSSNPGVAAIDATGVAFAVSDGSALITATFDGLTGASGLTVNVTLMSLTVTPATVPALPAGSTQQFTATGTYSDSSTQDLTNAVAWKSSNNAIVTIDDTGLATAVGAGTAGIAGHTSTLIKGATVVVPAPVLASGLSPCELLANAKKQFALLASGQAVAEVENPQLGRVVYTKADMGQLQRVIDGLAADCAASMGITTAATARRRPISIEAWP